MKKNEFYHNNNLLSVELVIGSFQRPFGCDKPAIERVKFDSRGWGNGNVNLAWVPELVHNDQFNRALMHEARMKIHTPALICARVSKIGGGPYRRDDIKFDFGQRLEPRTHAANTLVAQRLVLMEYLWRRSIEYKDAGRFYILPATLNINHHKDGGWFRYGLWIPPHSLGKVISPEYGHVGQELEHPGEVCPTNIALHLPAPYNDEERARARERGHRFTGYVSAGTRLAKKVAGWVNRKVDWSFKYQKIHGWRGSLSLMAKDFYTKALKKRVRTREQRQALARDELANEREAA